MASPRALAAWMAMARFSLRLVCPMNSARARGRREASNCFSSSWDSPEVMGFMGQCPAGRQWPVAGVQRPAGEGAEVMPAGCGASVLAWLVAGGFGGGGGAADVQEGGDSLLINTGGGGR